MNQLSLKQYVSLAITGVCVIGLTLALLYMQTIVAGMIAAIGLCALIFSIYSLIHDLKVAPPHSPKKISFQKDEHKQYDQLTLSAAKKMLKGWLAMRNSNTKQLQSRHYRQNLFPDSHGVDVDYAVPLWTIALSLPAFKEDSDKIQKVITDYLRKKGPDTSYLDSLAIDEGAAQRHLQDYVKRIKTHMKGYAPLGIHCKFEELYDFEVLIAENSRGYRVDDFGRYSTGGRTIVPFNKETIAFRATLNQIDITFIKSILLGNWDDLIQAILHKNLSDKNMSVIQTIRINLSHSFAIDIITSKLVSWINFNASPLRKLFKRVHTLSKEDLKSLLSQTVAANTAELSEIFDKEYIHYFTEPTKYNHLLNANKHNADVMATYEVTRDVSV
ncbi:hypothetical protein OAT84_00865 [Gammaproteobacteria bacterium]|nr:hypothetical protein [Gammaproteobacteria bacterium]